jgi:hypothetical protein
LFVRDTFHPLDDLAFERLCDGDVAHRSVGSCSVPVLLSGRKPDDVAGADFLDRAALALHPAAAERHDQRLAERVRVPRGARAGRERDSRAARAGALVWNGASIRTAPVNQSAGPLTDAWEPLRLNSMGTSP